MKRLVVVGILLEAERKDMSNRNDLSPLLVAVILIMLLLALVMLILGGRG